MNAKVRRLPGFFKQQPIYLLTPLLFILASIFIDYFFSKNNLINLMYQSADLIIISIGLTFVFLNGGIDFSITGVLGLASIVGAFLMNQDNGLLMNFPLTVPLTMLVMVLIGLGVGCVNGIAVSRIKMPSFIATIATRMFFTGIALAIANSAPVSNLPASFKYIGSGKVLGIPLPFVIAIAITALFQFVLKRTVFGRHVYAIGTNMRAARVSGVPVKKTVFTLFLISGALASVGAIISTARLGVGMPALGMERFIDFISAVVLGGASVFGGFGSIVGTLFGALFIAVLSNAMSMMGLQWYFIMVAKGAIVVTIALIDALKRVDR